MGERKERTTTFEIVFTPPQEFLFIIIYYYSFSEITHYTNRKLLVSSTDSNYQFYLPLQIKAKQRSYQLNIKLWEASNN